MAQALDRWKPALINAGSGAALVILAWVVEGRLTWPVLLGASLALGWGWWVSPVRRAQPHTPHERAIADAGRNSLIVYWRPGCSECIRLRRQLDRDVVDRLTWVNIMADPDGARYIRQFHDGDMTTPTVVTGRGRKVEPTAAHITARLS